MATATSFDLPNYVGELFQKAEKPNSVLRLIGGLTGALRIVASKKFAMGVDYTIPAGAQPAILEGADPTDTTIDTSQSTNLVQIFQQSVKIAYSKMGEVGSIDGLAVIPGLMGQGQFNVPGSMAWQIARKLEEIARDANYSFLRGAFVEPNDNNTARKMRGVRTAVSTNVFDNSSVDRDLTKAIFENALKSAMNNGMFSMGDAIFALCDISQAQNLHDLYKSETQLPVSDTVAGVAVRTIKTQWAIVHVVWEPDLATGEIFLFQPQVCRVTAMPIPGKGVLFREPLAQSGAAVEEQLYGELGIDYRHEVFHGVIDDLNS